MPEPVSPNPVAEDLEHRLAELGKLRRTIEWPVPADQRRRMLTTVSVAEVALDELQDRLDDTWMGESGWRAAR